MNFENLYGLIPVFNEIRVIGKNTVLNETVLDFIGAVLKNSVLKIYVMQYNEDWYEKKLMYEESGTANDIISRKSTNRTKILSEITRHFDFPTFSLHSIISGENTFNISQSSYAYMGERPLKEIMLMSEFLKLGYTPEGKVGDKDFQNLYLTEFEIEGKYDRIPESLYQRPFTLRTLVYSETHRTSKRLRLETGTNYPRAVSFKDIYTGEKHSFYIENVYLMDIWAEMEKNFSSHTFLSYISPEKTAKIKSDFYEHLSALCPRDMRLPVIEYEAEAGISLEFFSKAFLDSPCYSASVRHSGGIIGGATKPTAIFVRPDSPSGLGKHGISLKAAVVNFPVPADSVEISVEMLRFFIKAEPEDIFVC